MYVNNIFSYLCKRRSLRDVALHKSNLISMRVVTPTVGINTSAIKINTQFILYIFARRAVREGSVKPFHSFSAATESGGGTNIIFTKIAFTENNL